MEAVVGLLLVLISQDVETSCDGRQDGAQCVGALGGAVNIQLKDNTSEIPRFEFHMKDLIMLKWRNNRVITMTKRLNYNSSNGILRINNLNRNDGGEYTFRTFNSNGEQSEPRILQLSIQAPVSSVQLVSECLSQGELNVSCSSVGDSPQYSWTLDGHTLTDSELLSGNNQTNVIVLRQNISGRLVCSVRNQVSQSFSQEDISTCFIFINCTSNGTLISEWAFGENDTLCDEPTSVPPTDSQTQLPWYISQWPVIVGVFSAFVFVIVVGTAVMFAKRKTQKHQEEEDLTYIDIRIIQQLKRQKKQSVQSSDSQSL